MADPGLKIPPGQRLGKGMIIVAWLGVIGLLTLFFAGKQEERSNPNRNLVSSTGDGVIEVRLRRNAGGHYVAPGEINGRPVTFILDTGATNVAVPLAMKEELGLKAGPAVPTQTANGVSTSYLTRIDQLRLGDIVVSDVRAGLAKGFGGDEILLGMSVLSELELVQRDDTLIIRQYR